MRIYPVGPETARVMIVGDFPGESDLLKGRPLSGSAGFELKKMVSEAGMYLESCFVTSVVRERSPKGDISGLVASKKKEIGPTHKLWQGKHVHPLVLEGVEELAQEIRRVKPNVIVAMGNLAMFALTGEWGTHAWRSSIMDCTLVPGQKVIPTITPTILFAGWKYRSLIVHDLKRAKAQSAFPEIRRPQYNFIIRPDYDTAYNTLLQLAEQAEALPGKLILGADIETRAGHISCIGFAWSKLDAICIPFMAVENYNEYVPKLDKRGNDVGSWVRKQRESHYWSLEEEANLLHLIYRISQAAVFTGQNWNYDAQYCLRHWFWVAKYTVRDTMLKHHVCFTNMDKNLSFLSSMYCEDHLHWKDDRTLWQVGENGEGEEDYWRYNCTDCVRTYAIDQVLDTVIGAFRLNNVAAFQQRLANCVLRTMDKGLRVDEQYRAAIAVEIIDNVAAREAYLLDILGREINIKSPLQLQELFYVEFGQSPVLDKKSGNPTTNDEALHIIAAREPILRPICRAIAELRSLGVFYSTFVMGKCDIDGRMRTSFNIAGTDTLRFASRKNAFGTGINLQNVPSGGETEDAGLTLPNIRKLFIPDPGKDIFDTDLDSADLRIVAAESGCKWLMEQLDAGRKPYVEVAKEYYHDQTITKHHKSYPVFKALCHGTHYLGTPEGMAGKIGLSVKEVERIQKWYYGLCPEIKVWQEEIKKQVAGRRYITNVFGYRFNFFDKIEGTIFNQAVAWIPQSTVACLINRCYENIHNNLPEVDILIQVHDSLVGQYDQRDQSMKLKIIDQCQIVLPFEKPIIIPMGLVSSSQSWGHCKE